MISNRLRGFSLVEVLVSVVIISLTSITSFKLLSSIVRFSTLASTDRSASSLAITEIERIRSLPFSVAALGDPAENRDANGFQTTISRKGCNFVGTRLVCTEADCHSTVRACQIFVNVSKQSTHETVTFSTISVVQHER